MPLLSKKSSQSIISQIKEGEVRVFTDLYKDFFNDVKEMLGDEKSTQNLLKKALLVMRTLVLSNRLKEEEDIKRFVFNWCKKQHISQLKTKDLDQKIFQSLKDNDGWAFYYINMTYLPSVIQYIKLHGGSKEDAEDIAQDAILILINNVNEGKFQLEENTQIKTYFIGICKNLWKEFVREKMKMVNLDEYDLNYEQIDLETYDFWEELSEREFLTERQKVVLEVFEQATDTCKQILKFFYYHNYSHETIAEKMGFSNAESSKTQKNKCLKKLKISILNRLQNS